MPPRDTARLEDGAQIVIRPISPEDRQALAEGFERLSPESRYRRFFAPVTRLREHELDYLTRVDHHDHEALVAVDEATGEGIAVARFVRLDADAAEPAIVVADEWQRRGVAGHLLEALAERAREEGIHRFVAPVLAENAGAIAAFRRLGVTDRDQTGPELELTVDLTEPDRAKPLLREFLRGIASGALEPARGVWELLLRQLPTPPGFGRAIVVAVDDSKASSFAIDCAGELAATLELPVRLVAAYRPLLDNASAIEASLEQAVDRLRDTGVEVSARLQRGDPALLILYAAMRERAGLIVVGSPPPHEATPILSSSVWSAVAHNCQCHVLIARAP